VIIRLVGHLLPKVATLTSKWIKFQIPQPTTLFTCTTRKQTHVNMDYVPESQLGVSTMESQLGDIIWSFANQGRQFQIWHVRLEFWPLDPIIPQIPKFRYINIAFSLETHCCRRHTCTCAAKFSRHLGTECCLPKTTFRTKIGGGCARGASKNVGPPTYLCNRWS